MTWYEKIIAAHRAVTDAVSHGGRLKSERYFVWEEDGGDDLVLNGRHAEKGMRGTTDLFTKIEFDPWRERFEEALDDHGIAWRLDAVLYEEETGFWHWQWKWGVRYGQDRAEGV